MRVLRKDKPKSMVASLSNTKKHVQLTGGHKCWRADQTMKNKRWSKTKHAKHYCPVMAKHWPQLFSDLGKYADTFPNSVLLVWCKSEHTCPCYYWQSHERIEHCKLTTTNLYEWPLRFLLLGLTVQFRSRLSLNPPQTEEAKAADPLFSLPNLCHLFAACFHSLLPLFSLLFLPTLPQYSTSAYLPSSYVLDSDDRKKVTYSRQRESFKAHCWQRCHSPQWIFPHYCFPFFPTKVPLNVILMTVKTDSCRQEWNNYRCQCDRHYWFTCTIAEQWHSFLKGLEARGIHALSFCGQTSCFQLEQRGLSDYNITFYHFVLSKFCFICMLSITTKALPGSKRLGKIILGLTIHPTALLAPRRPTCHLTQITDSLTVCGPHSDIQSQLYGVGSWMCLQHPNSLRKLSVPCKMCHVRACFTNTQLYRTEKLP